MTEGFLYATVYLCSGSALERKKGQALETSLGNESLSCVIKQGKMRVRVTKGAAEIRK